MRRIVTVACLALACLGCSSGSHADRVSSGGSCATRITWDGALYYGRPFSSLPPSTLVLGTGGRPTCSDANGGEAGASTTVQVRRLLGVDPRIAVAVRGEPGAAYLAARYFRLLRHSPRSLDDLIACADSRKGCSSSARGRG